MTTVSGAWTAIQARIDDQLSSFTRWWPHENNTLPDAAAVFLFTEIITDRARIAGFGGGRGLNLYRNPAELNIYVMVPIGQGLAVALAHGETVAAAFRSYRTSAISCFDATVHPVGEGAALVPPGLSSAAGNYACAVVTVDMFFDQTG